MMMIFMIMAMMVMRIIVRMLMMMMMAIPHIVMMMRLYRTGVESVWVVEEEEAVWVQGQVAA